MGKLITRNEIMDRYALYEAGQLRTYERRGLQRAGLSNGRILYDQDEADAFFASEKGDHREPVQP